MKRFTYHHNKHDYELVIRNDVVVVIKDGEETYQIHEQNGCECLGYSFRGKCSHYDRAKDFGLFRLIEKQRESIVLGMNSDYIKKSRDDAIMKYAKKKKLSKSFTKFLIENMAEFSRQGKGMKELKNAYRKKAKRKNCTCKSKA